MNSFKIVKVFAACLIVLSVVACNRNPITGRKQLSLVNEGELRTLSAAQYKQTLVSSKLITSGKQYEMVKRVGQNIVKAIDFYYKQNGIGNALEGYQWEFNLIDSKDVNAWCMPGGKVAVYTGILPVTQNETALAIVLGHEITHAVAGHGAERMSQATLAQGLGSLGSIALGNNPKAASIFTQIYSPAASIGVLLPNSRNQEYEADKYGLLFAAIAGYDPQESIAFWKRMSQLGGQKPPTFLSTHPSDDGRIAKLQEVMPEALKLYKAYKK